jgi:hypothetical protein
MLTEGFKDERSFFGDMRLLFLTQLLLIKPQIIFDDFGGMILNYSNFPFPNLKLFSFLDLINE